MIGVFPTRIIANKAPALRQHGHLRFATVDPLGRERVTLYQLIEQQYRCRAGTDMIGRSLVDLWIDRLPGLIRQPRYTSIPRIGVASILSGILPDIPGFSRPTPTLDFNVVFQPDRKPG